MFTVKNKYETIFILNANLGEEETAALVEKFKSLIEGAGEIENVDIWGKRRLAYAIDDMNEGYYVLINFISEPSFPQELERVYKITDGVIRTVIIKKDEEPIVQQQ